MTRAALVALVVAALGLEGEAAETSLPFDHARHQISIASASDSSAGCTDCHSVDKRSRPRRVGHGACFGKCHGGAPRTRTARERSKKAPYAIDAEQRRLCTICHAQALLDRIAQGSSERLVSAPSRRADPAVSAPLPHAAHAEVSKDCLACHTDGGGTPSASHQRCVSCHRGASKPLMTECGQCHSGRRVSIERTYSTLATFDHGKHSSRLKATDDRCRSCHQPESILPNKDACRRCHDGAAAFSTVETACRRCHSRPDRPVPRPRIERVEFSHESHEGLERKLDCTDCHRLDASGDPAMPKSQHSPCADSECHATAFAERAPALCSACHVGTEPWLELYASRSRPPDTEFGALYSHRAHSGGDRPRHQRACTTCHNKNTSTRQLRLPRSHAACSGGQCHTPTTGTPPLQACSGCHVGNLVDERRARQDKKKWNVREKFSHEQHRTEPRDESRSVPCTDCHTGVDESDSIFDIPAPSKQQCARCHDGSSAFKLTGHGCSRCHDS